MATRMNYSDMVIKETKAIPIAELPAEERQIHAASVCKKNQSSKSTSPEQKSK